ALYQFKFQPVAWYITIGWIAFGLFLYYAIFEKRAAVFEPQVILPGIQAVTEEGKTCIMVALHNPDTVDILLNIAIPVARRRSKPILAVTVVDVPRQMPIHEGMRFAHHKEPLLIRAKKIAAERKIDLSTQLIIAHRPSDGILASIEQHHAEALIMGWKGYTNAKDRIFGEIADRIIRFATCDLMVLKIGEKLEMQRCLLPTSGGPNAKLAASILSAINKEMKMTITAGYIIPENATPKQKVEGMRQMEATLANLKPKGKCEKKLIEAKAIAGGIASASRDYDLVVIGAAKEPFFRKMLFGEIPEKVARFSPTSVLVVKKYEGLVKSILKKVLG
ncbi:MAG TPA: hypothetical protein ENH29_01910, partial [Bacteroidetes bacterium]|nr:hypothetical protein [Bacteroidota bacterium]